MKWIDELQKEVDAQDAPANLGEGTPVPSCVISVHATRFAFSSIYAARVHPQALASFGEVLTAACQTAAAWIS